MRIALIVLTWNSTADIGACLASLEAQDYADRSIIVVDNGSTDDTAAIVRSQFPAVRLIENHVNLGFCEGNNIGMRAAADADALMLINADTVAAPDMLTVLVATLSDPAIGVACPLIESFHSPNHRYLGGFVHWSHGVGLEHDAPASIEPIAADYAPGCALLIRASVVRQIGMLDPAFFAYFEDVDWCVRARRAGYGVVAAPGATIRHKGTMDQSGSKSAFAAFLFRRNQILFMRKHARWHHWPSFLKQYTRQCLMRMHDDPALADAILNGVYAGAIGAYGDRFVGAPRWLHFVVSHYLHIWLWLTSWLFFIDYQKAKRQRAS